MTQSHLLMYQLIPSLNIPPGEGGGEIFESVRLISDILEYTDDNNIEAILSSADSEKAFYSIDHCFLFSVLKSFGFGPDFIQWVRTLFKNSESCVMSNDFSTGYFALEGGTHQGDPLSAYLFNLTQEVMFIEVRSNVNIAGVKIGGHSVKLSAYADDTFFFTLDINSLQLTLNTRDKFEEYSSLTLFRLGSFGMIQAGGPYRLFLLYLWSNCNQTWHDGTLGQNLSNTIKSLLRSSLGGKYDVIKLFLVSF